MLVRRLAGDGAGSGADGSGVPIRATTGTAPIGSHPEGGSNVSRTVSRQNIAEETRAEPTSFPLPGGGDGTVPHRRARDDHGHHGHLPHGAAPEGAGVGAGVSHVILDSKRV